MEQINLVEIARTQLGIQKPAEIVQKYMIVLTSEDPDCLGVLKPCFLVFEKDLAFEKAKEKFSRIRNGLKDPERNIL